MVGRRAQLRRRLNRYASSVLRDTLEFLLFALAALLAFLEHWLGG